MQEHEFSGALGRAQHCGQAAAGLGQAAAQQPPPGQRGDQPDRLLRLRARPAHRFVERGPQIAGLRVQPGQPGPLSGAAQPRLGFFRQLPVVHEMAVAYGGEALRLVQPLGRVRGDGLQEPVARAGRSVRHDHQGAVDQPRDQVQHLVPGNAVPGADRFGSRQVAAVAVGGEAAQDDAFGRAEQLPAPVDHRSKRLLAGRCAALPEGQDPEAVVEPRGQLPYSKGSYPGGGELQRERDAVQTPADLGYGPALGLIRRVRGAREAGCGCGCPFHEQFHRVRRCRGSTRNIASPARPSGSWPVARTRRPGAVCRRSSVSSAAESTTCSQLSRTSRARRSRSAAARRCGREGVGRRCRGARAVRRRGCECGGDDLCEVGGSAVAHTGELHQPGSVGQFTQPRTVLLGGGRRHGESGLAHATGAGEGHQTGRGEEPGQVGEGLATTHEAGQRGGEVGVGRCGGGRERRCAR